MAFNAMRALSLLQRSMPGRDASEVEQAHWFEEKAAVMGRIADEENQAGHGQAARDARKWAGLARRHAAELWMEVA